MCIKNNMDLVFINASTKFYQNSSICSEILRKNTFLHQSRAITLLKMNEKYCSIIQICILSISMHIQNLIEIHRLIHKINKILTSIKGRNSVHVKIDQKQRALYTTWILYLSIYIQNFIKIHPFVRKILRKNTFLHQSRAMTLVVYKRI